MAHFYEIIFLHHYMDVTGFRGMPNVYDGGHAYVQHDSHG